MRNEPEAAGHFQCGRSPNEELRAVPGPRVPALLDVLLGWRPSLHPLRCPGCLTRCVVRRLHRYYCAIRLPTAVHAGRAAFAFSGRTAAFACSQPWGLPVLVHTISRRAGGLRLRGSAIRLAILRRNSVLPSPSDHRVGDLSSWFSKLYTLPVADPVYASDRTSRCAPQNSGSGWIRCSCPVGLFHSLLHTGLSRRSVCPTCFHQFSKGVHPHCVQAISRLSA